MPPKRKKTRQELTEQEGRIQLAIQALKNKENRTAHSLAVEYNVPDRTLHDRLEGRQFHLEYRNHNLKLSKIQEETGIKWILSQDCRGVPPRPAHVREMADIILQTDDPKGFTPVGENWVTQFIARRPEVSSRFARKYYY